VIFLNGSSAPPSSLFYSLFSRWPFLEPALFMSVFVAIAETGDRIQ
jgi:hypothetical protein